MGLLITFTGSSNNTALVLQLNSAFMKLQSTIYRMERGGLGLESWPFLSFLGESPHIASERGKKVPKEMQNFG